jgi:hypothetical protein
MKYSKKLYNADFTSGRLIRPRNKALRLITDILISPWYLFLFVVVCAFYPTALFADSYRYLRLQYLRLNDNSKRGSIPQRFNISFHNVRNMLTN